MADGSVLHGLSRLVQGQHGLRSAPPADRRRRHARPHHRREPAALTRCPADTAPPGSRWPSPAAALELLGAARDALGGTISAFELIARPGSRIPRARPCREVPQPRRRSPTGSFWSRPPTPRSLDPRPRWRRRSPRALESGLATDVLIAQNEAQRDGVLGACAKSIPEANRLIGAVSSHDISLPPRGIAEFVARGATAIAGIDADLRINCFGHLGDGNLHYNIFPPRGRAAGRLRRHPRRDKGDAARSGASTGRLGGRRARRRAVEDRRSGALRRSGQARARCGRSRPRSIPKGS